MAKKPIYMETTEISADRTATEVSAALVMAGASSVSVRYDKGKITGMGWTMKVGPNELAFDMPARVDPVYELLASRRSGDPKYFNSETKNRIRAQAERVAWRQLLRWVQAQAAMIEVGMVKPAEVFMPYIRREDGTTFFAYFENHQLQLAAPEKR
jgi:hypothetical protein